MQQTINHIPKPCFEKGLRIARIEKEKSCTYEKQIFGHLQYITVLLLLFAALSNNAKAQTQPVLNTPKLIVDTFTPKPISSERWLDARIVDGQGEPVSFASVRMKGHKIGTVTDEGGNFSLRVKNNNLLEICATSTITKYIIIRENMRTEITVERVPYAEIIPRNTSNNFEDEEEAQYKTLLQIRDRIDDKPIARASISIKRADQHKIKYKRSNKAGQYTLYDIRKDDTYRVTITAPGYQPRTITIQGYELNEGKNYRTIVMGKDLAIK